MAPAPARTKTSSNNSSSNRGDRNDNGSGAPKLSRKTIAIFTSAIAVVLLFLALAVVIIIRRTRKKKALEPRRGSVGSPEHDEAATADSEVHGDHIPPAMEKVPSYAPSSAPTETHQKPLSEDSVIEIPQPVHSNSSLYNHNPQSVDQASRPPSLQAPGAVHEPHCGFSQDSYGQPDPSRASDQHHNTLHTQYTPK